MKQTDWTKRLRDQLADHEEAAPEGLWADIEAALAKLDTPKSAPARRVPLWVRWAVAAAFAGLLIGNTYLIWMIGTEPSVAEGESPVVQVKAEQQMVAPKAELPVQRTAAPLVAQKAPASPIAHPAVVLAEAPSDQKDEVQGVQSVEGLDAQPTAGSDAQQATSTLSELAEQEAVLAELDRQIAAQTHRKSGLAFGLYAANGFGSQQHRNGVLMSANQLARYSFGHSATRGEDNRVWLYNYEERQKHYQPISFGLTLKFAISSVLSLSSGVVYTRLRSDFTNIANGYPIEQEQTLHYLGIPLSAQYRFWHLHGLNVYATAGGQIDYNVKAKYLSGNTEIDFERDRLQFSVQGALGIQYDFIPQLGIYAEPGVKYYFDNGSRVQNFFKDKPTNFNLQLGLRLNL